MKISDIDLNDLDVFEKGTPHHWFKLLRAEDPIHLHSGANGDRDYYCITKHADLKFISKNPELFSSERQATLIRDPVSDKQTFVAMRWIHAPMVPRPAKV